VPSQPPPATVLAAFGVTESSVLLRGGQGSSWRARDVVLKPLDRSESELQWQAHLFASIDGDDFRVARPLHARDGSLVVDGWCASEAVEGHHEESRWPEIIFVGERFHSALLGVPRPEFIAERTDPWAVGDRVAWGELQADGFAHVEHLPRLAAALQPVEAPSQLIHGDLTGNVLFAEQLPPAVIDFSPYWRPTPFASAIVVADALVWEGADESILESVAHVEDFSQYLLRALIYRAVSDWLFAQRDPYRHDDADPLWSRRRACVPACRERLEPSS
jgi:uncharacterized protein (TIGR02569 family)